MPDEVTMTAVLSNERDALWADLGDAIRRAINGRWSIECDNVLHRIRAIDSVLDFPMDWENVSMSFLQKFEELQRAAGIEPGINWATVRSLEDDRLTSRSRRVS